MLFKNGTNIKAGTVLAQTSVGLTAIVDAAVGDYFEIWVYQNSGGVINVAASADISYFQATLIQ